MERLFPILFMFIGFVLPLVKILVVTTTAGMCRAVAVAVRVTRRVVVVVVVMSYVLMPPEMAPTLPHISRPVSSRQWGSMGRLKRAQWKTNLCLGLEA